MLEEYSIIGHRERVAWRKAGRIPGWEVCMWKAIDMTDSPNRRKDALLTGGVPRLLKRGKNKGNTTWRDVELITVVVTEEEVEREAIEYEMHTKKCANCYGKGTVAIPRRANEGMKYGKCSKCGGKGVAS
jgi:hypothetical protein